MSAKNRGKVFQPAVLLPRQLTKAIEDGSKIVLWRMGSNGNYLAKVDGSWHYAEGLTPAGALLSLERLITGANLKS